MKNVLIQNKQDSYHKILNLIINKQRISRKEIADELSLAWGTVSSNINLMIDQKLIKEESPIVNGVGRSTCYLIPSNEKYAIIGVDINTIGISSSVVLLNGETIFTDVKTLEDFNQDEIVNKTLSTIQRAIEFNDNKYQIIAVGLSCQGDTYSQKGIYVDMPFIKDWMPINLVEIIENKCNIPTYQSHDMECLLLDLTFRNPGHNNFLVTRVVDGIGFGIIKDGVVLNEKISIDYGHEIIERNGLACECGQKGCLEAYSSIRGILRRLNITEAELFSNYKKYDEVLDDAIDKFSFSVYNVASIYNLKDVIICGKLFTQIPELFTRLEDKINLIHKRKNFSLNLNFLTDLSPSFGAALYALRKVIE